MHPHACIVGADVRARVCTGARGRACLWVCAGVWGCAWTGKCMLAYGHKPVSTAGVHKHIHVCTGAHPCGRRSLPWSTLLWTSMSVLVLSSPVPLQPVTGLGPGPGALVGRSHLRSSPRAACKGLTEPRGAPPAPRCCFGGLSAVRGIGHHPPSAGRGDFFGCPGASAEFAAAPDPPARRSESSPDGGKNLHKAVGTAGPSAQKHPAAELALRKKRKTPVLFLLR